MIKIITDSTACLTREFTTRNDIVVIPLKIKFSEEEFNEGFPDEFDSFYEKLDASGEFPKTSLPSPDEFTKVFKKVIDDGNEAICLTISSTLSGTFNSARLASDDFEGKISVVDSDGTCQSMLLLIEEMLELIEKGKSRVEIVDYLEKNKKNSYVSFVPNSMEYLKRGGRLNAIQASIADVLKIKPIFLFREGVLSVTKKVIGMNIAINEIIHSIPLTAKKIYALCIGESQYFEMLKKKLCAKFANIKIQIGKICPVLGAHVGPGTIGIAVIN